MSNGIADQIKALILTKLDVKLSLDEIDEQTPLFDGGMELDSFAVVELITLIENQYRFEFSEADLSPENFLNIVSIAELVGRHLPAPDGT